MSNSGSSSYSWGLTVLRVIVGIVFLMHGGQKLFVYGFHGVAGLFATLGIPLPAISAVVVTLVEFVGGAFLILGVATRLAAALLAFDMLVAILAVHLRNGFFDQAHGIEFPLSLFAASVCLALSGAGAASIGSLFARQGV
jgi:putative oxidoreductase